MHAGHPLTVNNSITVSRDGYGDGTWKFKGTKIRNNEKLFIKNASGHEVCAVSALEIDYVMCEH